MTMVSMIMISGFVVVHKLVVWLLLLPWHG
jgi:hypothetical protein